MADNVQWLRLKVGMFDGNSFKKIKRAVFGGVSYRDKLTAVWFELLDLAGKSNANGYLIDNNEIPYQTFEDIAIMIDRDEDEVNLCMNFYLKEKMVEIVDDVYCLTNFMQYQNQEGLERIREQNRERQAKFRERRKTLLLEGEKSNVTDNVTSRNSSYSNSNNNTNNSSNSIQEVSNSKRFRKPTLEEIEKYCQERNNGVDAQAFYDFYESKGWRVGNQAMKDWQACVRTWERREKSTKPQSGGMFGKIGEINYDGDD